MFWFLQRIAISLALLWVVTSLVFLSIYMVPGDPAELLLSGDGMTPTQHRSRSCAATLALIVPSPRNMPTALQD